MAESDTDTSTPSGKRVGNYLLEEEVAAGGMGVVWRALDERLGRRVALKFLGPALAGQREMRERFVGEARAASSLDHPNICTILEIDDTSDGETFIAMPWYEGETLERIIARGALPVDRAVGLALQIARGLAAAHDELLVHRDVKPANVMVTSRGTVKILDFGLARFTTSAAGDRGLMVGTPGYMAPEQIRAENVDERADIWALGVVLYEMLTGHSPFRGTRTDSIIRSILNDDVLPVSTAHPSLPPALDRIIEKSVVRGRAQRYERMEQMIDDLLAVQGDIDSSGATIRRPALARRTSLAVLPFTDMSPVRENEYLCDGIAEEILAALRTVPDLYVASRTSSFQFKERPSDVREIGAKLNVGHVLEGSVRRIGDRVRISAQLVSVEDGYRLWYERYDREMKDLFGVEEEIAAEIARALQVTLARPSRPRPAPPAEAEAYELYLQGRQFFHQHRRKAFEIAIQIFTQAIEIDPHHARAYAGIADCNAFLSLYFGQGAERVDAADEASRKALELAPELAEARTSRGLALFLRHDLEAAERELARAIELDPLLYEAHYISGRVGFSAGHIDRAAASFRQACAIVPEAFDSWYLLGMCYRRLGQTDRARAVDRECIEAAKKRVRVHPDDTRAWTMGAAVFAEMGEPERASQWVARALAVDPDEAIIIYNAACVYVTLGDFDHAIACLERVGAAGAPSAEWMAQDPDLDPIRSDPRFQALFPG